jgi:hypothetical protein
LPSCGELCHLLEDPIVLLENIADPPKVGTSEECTVVGFALEVHFHQLFEAAGAASRLAQPQGDDDKILLESP